MKSQTIFFLLRASTHKDQVLFATCQYSTILQPEGNIVKLTIVIIINSNHLRTHKGHSKVTSNQILGSFIPLLISAVLFLLREKNIKAWTAFIDPLFLSDSIGSIYGPTCKISA